MNTQTLLIEIGCEDLPAKAMPTLIQSMSDQLERELGQYRLDFSSVQSFITPRRMAVVVKALVVGQEDYQVHRLGPMVKSAFDESGSPKPGAIGFAKSCGLTVDQLDREMTDKGERLSALYVEKGRSTLDLLPEIVEQALSRIAIPRPMRWGNHAHRFLRPVHWSVVLFGSDVVAANLFGTCSGRHTQGHRVMSPSSMEINHADEYEAILESQGYVVPCFNKRREAIKQGIETILPENYQVLPDDALLNEVVGLVEWPVACSGHFDENFLSVPSEVLVSAMKGHQKYFPVFDSDQVLQPQFIFVSNIESEDPKRVVQGNERVLAARLSDARFFYEKDKKIPLQDYLPSFENVIFHKKLGSMQDKTLRLQKIASCLAELLSVDKDQASHAALLCKCDLSSGMVNEFPELQGIMGYYYALEHQESQACAVAIKEHYLPRFSGDQLPETILGDVLSLTDRLDNIVGLIGAGDAPTGDKDPFALRRQTYGLIRILSEKAYPVALKDLLHQVVKMHALELDNDKLVSQCLSFIYDRLKQWYLDQGFGSHEFEAVFHRGIDNLYDFHARMCALQAFMKQDQAETLAKANKRAGQILKKKNAGVDWHGDVDASLFKHKEEEALYLRIESMQPCMRRWCEERSYQKAMIELSGMKSCVDDFFDCVMVMDDDLALRNNRLRLLHKLRSLLCEVADISYLSGQ